MELETCPFCGGEATFDHDDNGWVWVACNKCGASTNRRTHAMEDCRPLLAEQWNRRASQEQAGSGEAVAWKFKFNNGAGIIVANAKDAEEIRRHLHEDETETPLFTHPQPAQSCERCKNICEQCESAVIQSDNTSIADLQTKLAALEAELSGLRARYLRMETESADTIAQQAEVIRLSEDSRLMDEYIKLENDHKRLSEQLAAQKVIEPFARLLKDHHERLPDDQPIYGIGDSIITVGDLRRAAIAAHQQNGADNAS